MKGSKDASGKLHTEVLPHLSPSELSRAVGGDLDTDWENWGDWSGFDSDSKSSYDYGYGSDSGGWDWGD